MADVHTANLCAQIVHSHFGPLTAVSRSTFTYLDTCSSVHLYNAIQKVALTLLTRGRLSLLQLTRFTALKTRSVRAAVLILIQQNLLWHAQSDDDGEVVEFNTDECLLRLRFGRYIWLAEQLFGSAAAEIVSLILDHGKLRPPDILSKLLSTNTKELREAKEKAEARLRREREEDMKIGLKKRKAHDHSGQRPSKRKAIEEDVVDDEVYFRIHASKFNVHIRNKLIEDAVRDRYNESAAIVMRAILKASEAKATMSDVRSDGVSTANIAGHISEDEDITSGLVYTSSKEGSTMTALKEYLGILAAADNPTPAGRAASFVSFSGLSSGKVHVELEIVCRRLRRRVLEAVARERYGDEAVRIIRLLLANGKMGGDQIAKVAMMAATAVRPLLTSLSADSLVSLQEVPKGADRNPQRTIYLWYVDLRKAYSVLIGNLYKTLFNIGMRRRAEEEDTTVKAVREKSERTDVCEDSSLLSRTEREVLRQWEERRDKLTVLETRVEEAVFILRDLAVPGVEDD
ncbi:hypothetical protein EW145_g1436 [Phellinidium pouzarii]|uniref:DNA-directed RNA polymerase III subunit RPC3 n=1 Tax=Phellinidium pouzarii TaxID=167371 RepID=A0A4S4LF35_9AGAM|nr:hypothetical protein EW145_g1436 [Phellinidium pouzarii]